jgi:hypothetical protein
MGINLGFGLGISKVKNLISGIPGRADALFTLDGTISGDNFVDKINGKLFPIANKDFSSDVKGFPYKTASTISAPANDSVLQATDINHFWYATDGTPNQIPVTAFASSDIDLENRGFARHLPQKLDANGVETFEPRVVDITLYTNPKTGADLVKCQTYYNVPSAEIYWLNLASGNDSQSGLTKALSKKTVANTETTFTTGGVNVLTGADTDTSITLTKVINWIGKGLSVIKTTATANGVIRAGNTTNARTIKGLIIDGQSQNGWIGINTTFSNFTIEKCYFKNCKSTADGIGVYAAFTSDNIIVKDSILTGSLNYGGYASFSEISGCLVTSTTAAGLFRSLKNSIIKNNKILASIATGSFMFQVETLGAEIYGNTLVNNGLGGIFYDKANTTFKTKFNFNTILQSDIGGSPNIYINLRGINSELNNNTITLTGVSITGTANAVRVILFSSVTTPSCCNNVIESNSASIFSHIELESTTVVCGAGKANNNRILIKKAINSVVIAFDEEKAAAQHNHFDGFEVNDNVVYCPAYYGNGYGTMHALFAWGNNGDMLRNYVNGAWIGCLMKGAGLVVNFNMAYNKLINCGVSLYIKGVSGATINNNYADTNCNVSSTHIIDIVNNGASVAHGTFVHNNTLIYRGTNAAVRAIYIDFADNLTGFTSDYNTFYSTNVNIVTVGSTNYTFAQWQALGYDLNSTLLSSPPAFDDSEIVH